MDETRTRFSVPVITTVNLKGIKVRNQNGDVVGEVEDFSEKSGLVQVVARITDSVTASQIVNGKHRGTFSLSAALLPSDSE